MKASTRPFLVVSPDAAPWSLDLDDVKSLGVPCPEPTGEYGRDWLVIEASSGPEAVSLLESDRLDVRPLSEREARELFEVSS